MQQYEVEIKSLLGSRESAESLLARLKEFDPSTKLISKNKQLNHYFVDGDLNKLERVVVDHLSNEAQTKLKDAITKAKGFSLRTRDKDGKVLLVLKISMGDDSSANGVKRMEFEEPVDLTLEELDKLVLSAGFAYQAKWSREREEYKAGDINVCLDKNAGYGWLAEFEKVVGNENELTSARDEVLRLMEKCGVLELPQDRLERMFAFYNSHWPEYYGTEKIFTVT